MRLLRLLRQEDGIALVMAMGMISVLAVLGSGIAYYSTTNARSATLSKSSLVAYSLAEAGVSEAVAVLNGPGNNALNPNLLPARTSVYESGTVTWSGSLNENASTPKWTITSVSRVKNRTGPSASDLGQKLTAVVRVTPVITQTLGSQAWNYIFSTSTGDPTGCDMALANNVEMGAPLYVVGNLCLNNQAWVSGGPLLVHGTVTLQGNQNSVGTSSTPINAAHVAGGCLWKLQPLHSPCSSADNVFANEIRTDPATITWPTTDSQTWYLNGSPGPYYPCTSQSGTPPVFDNDQGLPTSPDPTKRNRSVPGTFDLTPADSSYRCETAGGELSWNKGTKTLTVRGTVFIDGNAKIDNALTNTYNGHATLYLSGSLLLKSSKLCAVVATSGSTCDWDAWNPNDELLTFVAEGGGGQSDVADDVSIELKSTHVQAGLYGTQKIQVDTSAGGPEFQGPMVSSRVVVTQGITTHPFPTLTVVPTALPGNQVKFAEPAAPENFSG